MKMANAIKAGWSEEVGLKKKNFEAVRSAGIDAQK